ncbi:MAG: murein transglycosylase domain-containing protein [Bacteroidota bacterium]
MRTIKFTITYFILSCVVQNVVFTQANDDSLFQQFSQQQNAGTASFEKEYDAWEQKEKAKFDAYKTEVERKWREFQNSTREEWVDYDVKKDTKSKVNFEDGKVVIEALVPVKDSKKEETAKQKLQEKVQQLFTPENPAKKMVLENQVLGDDGKPITEISAKEFSRKIVQQTEMVDEPPVKGQDGIERVKVRVTITLVPDHIRKRAEQYLEAVRENAKRFKIDIALAFAIMQTESYFNPMAKSPVPAFGLMQLVPRSAGKDAYKLVYGKDEVVTSDYLYVPNQNVELGIAYLSILRYKYFKGVEDEEKLALVCICAYNTGAGNVSKALTKTTKLKPAIDVINKMKTEELYSTLLAKLPYVETKNYLKNVSERRKNYETWRE